MSVNAGQQARRQRIVLAAIDLLGDREYDRIQMRDVADEAHVALGTLYRYFPSKEQLFANVLLEWSTTFEQSVRRRASSGDPAARLVSVLRSTARAFERHPNFFRLIVVLEGATTEEVTEPFGAYAAGFHRVLAEALVGVDPDDAAAIASMSAAMLSAELRGWSHGRTTMRAVYERLERFVGLVFGAPRTV
jgi:AcrR family transcriptional regulator